MKNQALTIVCPGELKIEERPILKPGMGEVLIEVSYVAVCGSDAKLYRGTYTAPHKYPVVMGHEWIGKVVETGEDVDLSLGQAVVGDCSIYCGECYYCSINKNHCAEIEKRGITVDGGAANYLLVKAMHINPCPPVENLMPYTLTEPMSVAVNGICNHVPASELSRMRKALIYGAGGIGLMSLFTLLNAGIPNIILSDVMKEKVDRVSSFNLPGVEAVCTGGDESLESRGGFDLVVEATGHTECLQEAVSLASPCGHIVCLGHQSELLLDMATAMKKSLTIHTSNGSTGGFLQAMSQIQKYEQYVRQMITAMIPLSEAPQRFAEEIERSSNLKILIDMNA